MAEIAALGLAVNILNIVGYACNFARFAWDVWKLRENGLPGIAHIQLISEDLRAATQQLEEAGPLFGGSPGEDETSNQIRRLAQRCGKVAQQMLQTVDGLGIPVEGGKKRAAMVAAFRVKWSKEDILALENELNGLKSEIIMNLAIFLRAGMTKSLESQEVLLQHLVQLRKDNEKLGIKIDNLSDSQEGLGSRLLGLISSANGPSSGLNGLAFDGSLRASLMETVFIYGHLPRDAEAADIEIPERRRKLLEKKFLAKLPYDGMYERELTIPEAHEATFRWIFESPEGRPRVWDNFRQWLQSDQRLYWITGKAGSGKSTLLRFISLSLSDSSEELAVSPGRVQCRCTPYLLQWSKDLPLVIATFYFWAGSVGQGKLQTSREGLYRSLLSQVLEACPEAIPFVASSRWESLCLFDEDIKSFTAKELESMLAKAIKYTSTRMKMCLFIDGLDEFEGETRDHKALVDWIQGLVEDAPIKICVSSRPWRVFENSLSDKPNLLLEDLTYEDIRKYVVARFWADSEFTALQRREAEFAGQLIEEIVLKASGVFLWVDLVCTSLLSGIMAGDRIRDLRKRLEELSPDLETLYDRILDKLDPIYANNAAQFFFLMLACDETPQALLFWFADETEGDPDFSIKMPNGPLLEEEIRYRVSEMRKRLNSRCKGLLSITKSTPGTDARPPSSVAVQYLHRTVKEFVKQSTTRNKLLGMLETPFDPHVRLSSALLAMWKARVFVDRTDNSADDHCVSCLSGCLRHASLTTHQNSALMIRLLEEMEKSLPSDDQILVSSWEDMKSDDSIPLERNICFGNTFLSLAICYGVMDYVKWKIRRSCLVLSRRPRAIDRILQDLPRRAGKDPGSGITPLQAAVGTGTSLVEWPLLLDALLCVGIPNPAMVSLLLKKGANPNYVISRGDRKSTIWTEILAYALLLYSLNELSFAASTTWAHILELMVRHGANRNARTISQALGLVGEVCDHLPLQIGLSGFSEEDMPRIDASNLQKTFRAMRFGSKGEKWEVTLREVVKGTADYRYNPYNPKTLVRRMKTTGRLVARVSR